MNTTRRLESPRDEAFLNALILETIAAELGAASWPDPVRKHLLGIQVHARRHSSRANFPQAISEIIQADGIDAGWMLTAAMPHEVRLIEIMVEPRLQGRGIGTAAIRSLLADARTVPVRLAVNLTNASAIRLYERLGFRKVPDGPISDEVQQLMEKL